MKILITNDDGINAIGIRVLAKTLSRDFEVVVIAPDSERSASGHSISCYKPIKYERADFDNIEAYSISGTPADCVKLGLLYLVKDNIDMIITGMNNGENLGSDIMYSGTVNAALEGAHLGKRSIATSLSGKGNDESKYVEACNHFNSILPKLIGLNLTAKTVLNYNYPLVKCIGTAITTVGVYDYDDYFLEDEESKNVVRLMGTPRKKQNNITDTDVEMCRKGYATISPVIQDLNDNSAYNTMKNIKL